MSPFSVTIRDLFMWTCCADVLGSKSRWNYSAVGCLVSRLQRKLSDTETLKITVVNSCCYVSDPNMLTACVTCTV